MYRRSTEEINNQLKENDFEPLRCVEFSVVMDPKRSIPLHLKGYVARKTRRI